MDTLFDPEAPPTGQVRAHRDLDAAVLARDLALADVAKREDDVAAIAGALRALLADLVGPDPEFTTDDVWTQLGDRAQAVTEPRAMGVAMRAAAKAGLIVATPNYRPSHRPACHARPVRVWRKA